MHNILLKKLLVLMLLISIVGCKTIRNDFNFPSPTGEFGIGTKKFEVVSKNRPEMYTKDSLDKRRFILQVWYPVLKSDTYNLEPLPYGDGVVNALAMVKPILGKLFSYLSETKTHTYSNVEFSPTIDKAPLIIFSPGNKSSRFQNLIQIEDLVSRGYVVLGVDHPYTAAEIEFSDGTTADWFNFDNPALGYSGNNWSVDEVVLDRSRDITEAINYIEELSSNSDSFIYNKIDFDKIGAIGHSLGGSTVLQAASDDSRIKALFLQEAGIWGPVIENGVHIPTIYMQASGTLDLLEDPDAGEWVLSYIGNFKNDFQTLINNSTGDFYYLIVNGFNHYSFTDMPMFSSLFSEDIEAAKAVKITKDYVNSFFDKYILSRSSIEFPLSSDLFTEVKLQKNPSVVDFSRDASKN